MCGRGTKWIFVSAQEMCWAAPHPSPPPALSPSDGEREKILGRRTRGAPKAFGVAPGYYISSFQDSCYWLAALAESGGQPRKLSGCRREDRKQRTDLRLFCKGSG